MGRMKGVQGKKKAPGLTTNALIEVRHQPSCGPDFGREKVGRHKGGPMRSEKRAPRGRPLTTGWDAVRFAESPRSSIARRDGPRSSAPLESACSPTSDSPWPSARPGAESRRAPRGVLVAAGRRSISGPSVRGIVSGVTSVATSRRPDVRAAAQAPRADGAECRSTAAASRPVAS